VGNGRSNTRAQNRRHTGGFTLMDVLVSMAIIAVLIGLLLPAISRVNEVARRVACQSNVRQLGISMLMYADANRDYLPHSVFVEPPPGADPNKRPSEMIFARLDSPEGTRPRWDGLGHLYEQEYMPAPQVFYCPSHSGLNRYDMVFPRWQAETASIPTNYHFRGEGPVGNRMGPDGQPLMTRQLFRIDPSQSSLIADGMRSQADINHRVGANFFRADLTVHWFRDDTRSLLTSIPVDVDPIGAASIVASMWNMFDQAANAGATGSMPGPR
jgi:type II secretory pathway pseudopilin PulG